jgi:hypothetical protein
LYASTFHASFFSCAFCFFFSFSFSFSFFSCSATFLWSNLNGYYIFLFFLLSFLPFLYFVGHVSQSKQLGLSGGHTCDYLYASIPSRQASFCKWQEVQVFPLSCPSLSVFLPAAISSAMVSGLSLHGYPNS